MSINTKIAKWGNNIYGFSKLPVSLSNGSEMYLRAHHDFASKFQSQNYHLSLVPHFQALVDHYSASGIR